MAEPDSRGHFWIYVWLGISMLLNLSGMASIIDGFVVWTKFFRDFIDVYRAVIRQPLAWLGQFIWPFGPIPGWVFDGFVIWAAAILAYNITTYRMGEQTLLGEIHNVFRKSGGAVSALFTIVYLPLIFLLILLAPLAIVISVIERKEIEGFELGTNFTLNFLFLIATFTLLLFINWQIRQHGG